MSAILSTIDLFGAAYTFKNNRKEKYKTSLGGMFSIVCFSSLIFFTVIFGLDFYTMTNPKVSIRNLEH